MTRRTLTAESISFLKTATRRLIREAGGLESAASVSRVGKSMMSDYQNPELPDHFMPVDVAAELEADTGEYHLTQAMCRLAGGYFVKGGQGQEPILIDFSSFMPEIGQKIGKTYHDAAIAMSDGKITDKERLALISDIEQAIAVLISARNSLDKSGAK